MKIVFALLFCSTLFFNSSAEAQSQIYIKAGEAKVKKSLMALPQFNQLSTPTSSSAKVGKDIYDTVLYDLSVSSYFDFIKPEAFLEDTSKVGLKPGDGGGFNFSSWKQIGTEFLVRAGYKVIGNEITFETYLYYVPQAKLVFGKAYKGTLNDARLIAHTYANDVVRELTGKKGIFTTKFVASRSAGKGIKEIFVYDWDGGNAKQISAHKSIASSPAWSPDGRQVVYRAFAHHDAKKARNADAFIYELKSGKRFLISYRQGINSGASYFPDGKNLLLTLSMNGNPDLYKMTTDGRNLVRITNGPRGAMNVEPAVSPDGSKIAFSSDRSGKPMIYVMNVDGSNVNRLTFAGDYNATPRWSPDGKKIVFAGFDKGHFDLFVMDANGENMIRLTSATKPNGKMADNEEPSFSPDGRHIMFVSNRSGNNQVYIVDADGENERRITFDKNDYYRATWSPYLD
jgi:TolB protein